jgi:hypothetical protein
VVFVGGFDSSNGTYDSAEVFDLATFDYSFIPAIIPAPRSFNRFGTCGHPNVTDMPLMGGFDSNRMTPTVRIDVLSGNPLRSMVSPVNMTIPRGYGACATFYSAVSNGFVTVYAGGSTASLNAGSAPEANVTAYSSGSNTIWTLQDPLLPARDAPTATVTEDENYLIITGKGVAEVYFTSNLTLRIRLGLLHNRTSQSAAALGPYVYIGGGVISGTPANVLGFVEVIDTRDWSLFDVENLTNPVYYLAAVGVKGGGVFFYGGIKKSNIN